MSGQVGDCLPSPPPTSRALLMYPEVPHLPRLQASLWCPLVPPLEKVIVRSFSFWYLCLAGSQTYSFLEIIMIMAFFFQPEFPTAEGNVTVMWCLLTRFLHLCLSTLAPLTIMCCPAIPSPLHGSTDARHSESGTPLLAQASSTTVHRQQAVTFLVELIWVGFSPQTTRW